MGKNKGEITGKLLNYGKILILKKYGEFFKFSGEMVVIVLSCNGILAKVNSRKLPENGQNRLLVVFVVSFQKNTAI